MNLEEEIYTISDTVDNELTVINAHLRLLNKRFSMLSGGATNELAFDNPVYQADDNDVDSDDKLSVVAECTSVIPRTETVVVHKTNQTKINNDRSDAENGDLRRPKTHENCSVMKRGKRYETWPSPQAKRKRSLKRNQTNATVSFSVADRNDVAINSNAAILNNVGKPSLECRKCSSVSLDGMSKLYSNKSGQNVRFNMKDNRMKYSLRQHAMASVDLNPNTQMDACAVEALSKEDLLVLWKRSEIELQTKLNRILHQNNHLRLMVDRAREVRTNSGCNYGNYGNSDNETTQRSSPIITSTRL